MKKSLSQELIEWTAVVIPTWILIWFSTTFIIANAVVPSGSMEATIMTGSRLIGNRLAYSGEKKPERQDIVIFKYPDDESVLYVKRIIGVPGDIVELVPYDSDPDLKLGNVLINGHPIYENYLIEPMEVESYQKFEVPNNAYFCMGDNRNNSRDSRYWFNSFVYEDKIVAKVIFQWWKGLKKF